MSTGEDAPCPPRLVAEGYCFQDREGCIRVEGREGRSSSCADEAALSRSAATREEGGTREAQET